MKKMSKKEIIDQKQQEATKNELKFLSSVKSDFIGKLHYAFQDKHCLYLVMDLLPGCDLRYHMIQKKNFDMECSRFFIACLIEALEDIHEQKIVHRDVKPENLAFDDKGYLRLVDFGLALRSKSCSLGRTSGSVGYMAPEVSQGLPHGEAADIFAIGVIAFECMTGRTPYPRGTTRLKYRDRIQQSQARVEKHSIPPGWTENAADFINKCLLKDPKKRIGNRKGVQLLKKHSWFKGFNWEALKTGDMVSPYLQ